MAKDNGAVYKEILKTIRETIDEEIVSLPDDALLRNLIIGYRPGSATGLQLTNLGLKFMKKCYSRVEVACEQKLSMKAIAFLSRKCEYPFHIDLEKKDIKRLTFFDTEFGMYVQLCDADFDYLIDKYSD